MLGIALVYSKLLKFCFIIGKVFGFLGLYVVVKGIICFLVAFGCLEVSKSVSLAFNILASINDLRYFS